LPNFLGACVTARKLSTIGPDDAPVGDGTIDTTGLQLFTKRRSLALERKNVFTLLFVNTLSSPLPSFPF
jgi:hypothetical protein